MNANYLEFVKTTGNAGSAGIAGEGVRSERREFVSERIPFFWFFFEFFFRLSFERSSKESSCRRRCFVFG